MIGVRDELVAEFAARLREQMPMVERINGFSFTADYGPGGWGPLWFFSGIVVGGRERSYHDIKAENRATIDSLVRSTIGSVRDQGVGDLIARHYRSEPDIEIS